MKRKIKLGPGRLHHQTARSYCFVPPLKPSPLRGEGVTADAVTDEGASLRPTVSASKGFRPAGRLTLPPAAKRRRVTLPAGPRLHVRSAWGPQSAFPRTPVAGDTGLGYGAGVRRGWGTTPASPVCAAAVGGSNGRADPTVVSRLPWQNRDSRCKTGGRMICAPTQRPKGTP